MVKEGKFYVDGDEVVGFGVSFSSTSEGMFESWIYTTKADFCSDPFDTPEDALANLLTVLNEG